MQQATYVRTETRPLADLTPFPGNAKRGDVPTILESLCRNGQYRSLIVRATGEEELTVLAGNHTLQAIAAHGPGPCGLTVRAGEEEHVCALCGGEEWEPAARVEVVTCDDSTARRINLVDNRSSEKGSYDDLALAELLSGMDDLTGTGWTDTELSDLLTVIEEAEPEDAYAEEEPEEPAAAAPAPAGTAAVGPSLGLSAVFLPPAPAGEPAPPAPTGQVSMLLTYSQDDRNEAAALVSAARAVFPSASSPEIILRALRALVALTDVRHSPDSVVTVAELLKAAGIQP